MPEHLEPDRLASPLGDDPVSRDGPERRHRHAVSGEHGGRNPRVEAAQHVMRHRLEPFHCALAGLAVSVFGAEATVVPHLRGEGRRRRLTFVVDAADPLAHQDYARFLPKEREFWTAYAQIPKPPEPFAVAIRPARGWCRSEALAPFFAYLPPAGDGVM